MLFDINKDFGLPIIYYTINEIHEEIKVEKLMKVVNTWEANLINVAVSLNNNYTSNLFNHFINEKNKS
jgi:hypothetical protein